MYFNAARLRLFLLALLALQFATWYGSLPLLRTRYIDYRSFYAAGTMVRTGQAASLYDYEAERRVQDAVVSPNENALPYMPAPFTAIFFVPLSLLPFRASYFVFLAMNLAFAALAVWLLRPWLAALSSRWRPLPAMLFLTFLPLGIALMFGQLSILLLLLYCAAFVLLQTNRPFLAGLVLALTLMKFQVAIPVLLLFAVWRCWRLVAGVLAGGAGLLLISLALIGRQALMAYPLSLLHMTANASTKALQVRYGIVPAEMPNLLGFFHCLSAGHVWGEVFVVVLSLACLVWAALQKPSLPLALLAGVLVSYHLFLYDLTLLLLPICLVVNRLFAASAPAAEATAERARPPQWAAYGAAMGCAFLLCSPAMRLLVAANVMFLACIPVAMLFLCIGEIGSQESVVGSR